LRLWRWWCAWLERAVQRAAMRRFRRWADQRQAAFAVERGRARTAYLAWLAARELPGTPRTVLEGGDAHE
jgi:hypothetical protein